MIRWAMLFILILFVGFLVYIDLNNDRPSNLGVTDGLFVPCPMSPNCVSSQAPITDGDHFTEPLMHDGDLIQSQLMIEKYFLQLGNHTVVTSQLGYVHIEAKSKVFGFIDDIELYWPEADSVIHIRSASRVGYSDMNVNRQRVEQLRQALTGQY